MEEKDLELTEKQRLKKEHFGNINTSSTKTVGMMRTRNSFKSTNQIFNNLIETREFSKLKSYMSMKEILSKFINPKIMEMIIFGFYKNTKLTIKVMHPVAQQEINFKKQDIISVLQKTREFYDIKEVTIFREDKLNKFNKFFDKNLYYQLHPNGIKELKEKAVKNKIFYFPERSLGIFENKTNNKSLNKFFESIRLSILENREKDKTRE